MSKLTDAVRRAISALTPAPAATTVAARHATPQPRTELNTSTMTTTTPAAPTTTTSALQPTQPAPAPIIATPVLTEAEQAAYAAITRSTVPTPDTSKSPAAPPTIAHFDLSAKSAPAPVAGSRIVSPTQRKPSTPSNPWTQASGEASIPRSVSPVDRYTVAIADAGWKVDVSNPAGVMLVGGKGRPIQPEAILYGFRDYLMSIGHYPSQQVFDGMAANVMRDVLMALPKTAALLPEAA